MKTIVVIVAMESEFNLVKSIIKNQIVPHISRPDIVEGENGDCHIVLSRSGIGKVNAAVRTTELINSYRPDYLINTGVAGGLGKGVRQGHLVVSTQTCYHDVWCGEGQWGQVQGLPLYFDSHPTLVQAAQKHADDNTHFGLICSGDQFITSGSALDTIKNNFPEVLAVDMETAPIAHVCFLHNTPFMSVRVISDNPDESNDNTNQYFDFMRDAPARTFNALAEIIASL